MVNVENTESCRTGPTSMWGIGMCSESYQPTVTDETLNKTGYWPPVLARLYQQMVGWFSAMACHVEERMALFPLGSRPCFHALSGVVGTLLVIIAKIITPKKTAFKVDKMQG